MVKDNFKNYYLKLHHNEISTISIGWMHLNYLIVTEVILMVPPIRLQKGAVGSVLVTESLRNDTTFWV